MSSLQRGALEQLLELLPYDYKAFQKNLMVLWSNTYKASSRRKISHLINDWIVHNTNCWNFSNCKTNGDANKWEPTDSIIITIQYVNMSI